MADRGTLTEAPPDVPGVTALVRIDDGGYCAVYRGRETGGGRGVAVKILPAPFDRVGRALFDRERGRVRRLADSPSVLQVDEVGTLPDGRPYLVSQLCAESCAQRVELDGPMSPDGVAALGAEIGAALARVHELGLVHGAVTPHNVLFRRDGQAVLADIGVAARQAYQGDLDYCGEYAAPETLRHGTVGEPTDLYGLGCTLYTALLGKPPFPRRVGEHPSERILRMLAEAAPTVSAKRAGGAELAAVINELLQTRPEDRPDDAAGIAARCAALVPPPAAPDAPVPDEVFVEPFAEGYVGGAAPPVESLPAPNDLPAETSTDWSGLLDDVLCDAGAEPSVRPREPARPTYYEPRPDVPAADPFTVHPLHGRPAPDGTRRRPRTVAALFGAVAAGAVLLGLVNLVGTDDRPAARPARTVVADDSTAPRSSTAARVVPIDVRLLTVRDTGRSVVLRWTGDPAMEYAVVIGSPGQPPTVLPTRTQTLAVPVLPGRPYCVSVQATDGTRVIETQPKALRGARC